MFDQTASLYCRSRRASSARQQLAMQVHIKLVDVCARLKGFFKFVMHPFAKKKPQELLNPRTTAPPS